MALDFEVIDKGCTHFSKPYKIVSLPEEFHLFFLQSKLEFPSSALELLYEIDIYDDTILSYEDLKSIQQLCVKLHAMFIDVQDYSIYDVMKQYKIRKKDLIDFADSMENLVSYAFENDKSVWAVGD